MSSYVMKSVPRDLYKAARKLALIEQGPTGHKGSGPLKGHLEPPDNRRCAEIRRCGKRCKNWVIPGSTRCRYHRGKGDSYVGRALKAGRKAISLVTGHPMPENVRMFYKQHLSKTLADQLEACLHLSESEQTSLLEDLALMRSTILDIAKLYDVAKQAEALATTLEARQRAQETKISLGQHLRDAQGDLADLCDKIEKHRALRREQTGISVHAVAYLTKQMAALAYQVCGDDLQLAMRFEEGLRQIRLPQTAEELTGTLITPDQDVLEMDSTIPRLTDDPAPEDAVL